MFYRLGALAALLCLLPPPGAAADVTSPGMKAALLVIDVQACFLPGGSLAVGGGDDVIPVINWIRRTYKDKFSLVAMTKDWHCDRHVSFATSHNGSDVGDLINLQYNDRGQLCLGGTITPSNFPEAVSCTSGSGKVMTQVMWPDHCVQDVTSGPTSSNLDPLLYRDGTDVIVTKGTDCQVDSYSAFYDNGRFAMTSLQSALQSAGIDIIFVTGLALDYCVKFTAIDGKFLGYKVYVITDATRGVAEDTSRQALEEFKAEGIHVIDSVELDAVLRGTSSRVAVFWPVLMVVLVNLFPQFW